MEIGKFISFDNEFIILCLRAQRCEYYTERQNYTCMTDTRGTTPMYVNHSIVVIDLLTMYFGNEVNDISIDFMYAAAVFYLIAQA